MSSTEIWTEAQLGAMVAHPEEVARRLVGDSPAPATVSLVRLLGRTLLDAEEGSTLGLHAAGGRLHIYPVPADYRPAWDSGGGDDENETTQAGEPEPDQAPAD